MKIREEVQYILLGLLMIVVGAAVAYHLYFRRGFLAESFTLAGLCSMAIGVLPKVGLRIPSDQI